MQLDEYVKQELSLGKKAHHNNGVWWLQTPFQRCVPLYPLQEVEPGDSSPKVSQSFIRYSHLVPENSDSNSNWNCMFLDEENFSDFCFEKLKHEKRKAINRSNRSGLKVQRISDIEQHWKDLQTIYISTAMRTQYGLPESYYLEKEEEWKTNLRREFNLPGRDWFGVFLGESLIAFLYSCFVHDTGSLLVTKFNSDYTKMRPSDALHFHVISYYKGLPECRRIYAGRSVTTVATIDRFKAGYGFAMRRRPAFQRTNGSLVFGAKTILLLAGPVLKNLKPKDRRGFAFKLKVLENSIRNIHR